ncbi:MAG: HNH endonuclease [Acidothermus sp.]|nr:HNH endonuclease [Acidothermus sp.]MCL6537966.1 HNH endonuclease [Acidothermus sp.]
MRVSSHALVLNATYEPIGVVSGRRALLLVLTAKATVLETGEHVWHSASATHVVPAVVRLTRFVKIPYRSTVPLTRRGVFLRDGGRCVYCDAPATSLDHVVPRSRGGAHVWENVVSCCRRCNHLKGDRTVAEMGWRLRRPPRAPSGPAWRILGSGRSDPRWIPYLDGLGIDGSIFGRFFSATEQTATA